MTARRILARHRTGHSDNCDMSLPPGMTCGDCVHLDFCTALMGQIPEDEVCDWSPSRFRFVRRMCAADIGWPG